MQEYVKGGLETDKLTLDARKKLSMTGITNVDGFSETSLKLSLEKTKVLIIGENIKITSYNKNTGSLTAEGLFSEIKYNHKKAPLVKRLFK